MDARCKIIGVPMENIVAPTYNKGAFHCPHANCRVYAKQDWRAVAWIIGGQWQQIGNLRFAACDHCGQFSIWLVNDMIYPVVRTTPQPHPDMPDPVKSDFDEARAVFSNSPRSSAALLRLAIQKLCIALGQPGKNLNDDIGQLVKQGLSIRVQRSLDIVRVVGNNQVHPGTLDVRDDPDMALRLFELVNIIVEDRIAGPKQIDQLYGKLPEAARKQIEERDG